MLSIPQTLGLPETALSDATDQNIGAGRGSATYPMLQRLTWTR